MATLTRYVLFLIRVINDLYGVTGIRYFPVPGPVQLPDSPLGLVHIAAEDRLYSPHSSGGPGGSGGRHLYSHKHNPHSHPVHSPSDSAEPGRERGAATYRPDVSSTATGNRSLHGSTVHKIENILYIYCYYFE